ncbi:MAG: hypothetical protein QXE76_05130 [Candidatus Bathyarchaeia archaeon]
MRRENLSACFTLLLLFFTALAQPNFTVSATPNIIRVPQDYPTIQEAINAATSGDTILVAAGTYYEHVIINKTVSLKGEGPNVSVIDGKQCWRYSNYYCKQYKNRRFYDGKWWNEYYWLWHSRKRVE